MARSLGISLALAVAPLAAPFGVAHAQDSYATIEESDARIVVARTVTPSSIEFRFNLLPKDGLRVSGAHGIKVSDISAVGWRFDPPLPRIVYAGSDFFARAPEIAVSAAPRADAQEAVVLLMYALCREQTCYPRDTSIAITQR